MTRRRWIADEWSGDRASLLGAHAEHLTRVLRARIGQEFDIAVGGQLRTGRIASIAPDRVEFELGGTLTAAAGPSITVAMAIFKFDRFEWAIEKLTELGAAKIIPFAARRSEAHLVSAAGKRVERWRRVAHSAAEQSRRASPPEITNLMKLRHVLADAVPLKIVLSEAAAAEDSLVACLRDRAAGELALALGPEGGWTEDELRSFSENGWHAASLGATILRAETAAIAAMAITAAEFATDHEGRKTQSQK